MSPLCLLHSVAFCKPFRLPLVSVSPLTCPLGECGFLSTVHKSSQINYIYTYIYTHIFKYAVGTIYELQTEGRRQQDLEANNNQKKKTLAL